MYYPSMKKQWFLKDVYDIIMGMDVQEFDRHVSISTDDELQTILNALVSAKLLKWGKDKTTFDQLQLEFRIHKIGKILMRHKKYLK